ncbi:MAG: glycosyltransferase family 2 protein [Propioniciclava sp.]|uniref:glycosyltransferase family 2 protein n=1 Tax=Propioniciclava sp. TaxID=2038686 RepID=UPI0039E34BE2
MSDPLVTVLMPVYNGEQYLAEAIDSVLTQDAADFELLVIDDGSTDGTPEILRSYTDPRLRVVRVDHLGLIGALNHGLEVARGTFLSRTDADDLMSPGRLRRQLEHFEQHPATVACGTPYELFGAIEGIVRPPRGARACRAHLIFGSSVPHATVLIRADVIRRNNVRYREGYLQAEDFKLFSELSEFGELRNLSEVGLRYRQHPEQVTRRESDVMIRTHLRICVENLAARGVRFSEERMRRLLWPQGAGLTGVLVYLVRRLPVLLYLGARTGGLAGVGQALLVGRERVRGLLRR